MLGPFRHGPLYNRAHAHAGRAQATGGAAGSGGGGWGNGRGGCSPRDAWLPKSFGSITAARPRHHVVGQGEVNQPASPLGRGTVINTVAARGSLHADSPAQQPASSARALAQTRHRGQSFREGWFVQKPPQKCRHAATAHSTRCTVWCRCWDERLLKWILRELARPQAGWLDKCDDTVRMTGRRSEGRALQSCFFFGFVVIFTLKLSPQFGVGTQH